MEEREGREEEGGVRGRAARAAGENDCRRVSGGNDCMLINACAWPAGACHIHMYDEL